MIQNLVHGCENLTCLITTRLHNPENSWKTTFSVLYAPCITYAYVMMTAMVVANTCHCAGMNCMQWSATVASPCHQATTYHTFVPRQEMVPCQT